jgi:pyridoxal phosphate enzyme (YggS family)
MPNLEEYYKLQNELKAKNVQLIAVSKTKPKEDIMAFYEAGHRAFGENRVQELVDKYEALPKDIEWHLIGHLQRNKVKYIIEFVHLIHAIDSPRLLEEVNKRAGQVGRKVDVLLQFHIAEEESKFGFDWAEVVEMLESESFQQMENIQICGLMAMATFTDDEQQLRREFQQLKGYFDRLKTDYFADSEHFKTISMGMSGDFELAVEEGSTMVRVGSLLFGSRS